ncbi:MAG: hypothetical protein COZ21_12210 [Bacteroidetes bacterium CG_4_10_14_3_um_filter_31_20]|nr:phytase [Bacteroidota bacterium]PIX36515.1 MAG: hypothetical protein COZ59_00700 [Bacteroidetes bacterium CG_4_8_14_3_um_filter_31_14]PIY02815.1 MAG: hypothetical protein COZ21_12210 [Bacteroidetes bacterium CG_4_10_14_3_um_filter_31_20]
MIYPKTVYKIRGIVFDIFNNVVGNWSEDVFEEILKDALEDNDFSVEQQKEFEVYFKGNRVGLYRTDLIVDNKIIIELKVVPEIYALHKAQIISYLKVTDLKLGILINFGGEKLFIKAYPNNVSNKKVINTNFDIHKNNLSDKDKNIIAPYLEMGKEILETLGPGYFHQIYRRSFWDELNRNNIGFEQIKYLELNYKGKIYGSKEVRFYKLNELLLSIVAVESLNELIVKKFSRYVKHYNCNNGLIINFNNTIVDFRFI